MGDSRLFTTQLSKNVTFATNYLNSSPTSGIRSMYCTRPVKMKSSSRSLCEIPVKVIEHGFVVSVVNSLFILVIRQHSTTCEKYDNATDWDEKCLMVTELHLYKVNILVKKLASFQWECLLGEPQWGHILWLEIDKNQPETHRYSPFAPSQPGISGMMWLKFREFVSVVSNWLKT